MRRIQDLFQPVLAAALSVILFSGCGFAGQKRTEQTDTVPAEQEMQQEEAEELWLQRYVVETSFVAEEKEAVLFQQECEGGFLAYINRKVREEIPAERKEDPDFVNDGRYDVYESALFTISKSGKRHKVRRYRTQASPENTENLERYYSETRPRAFRTRRDGSIVVLESSYEAWLTNQGTQTRDRYYVRLLRENGVELSSSEIETIPGAGLECGSAVLLGMDLVAVPQGDEVLFFGLDGKKQFSVSTPFPIRELCRTRDEELAVVLNENGRLWVSVIDVASRTASVPQRVPEGAHCFCAGETGEVLCYLRNSEIFSYNLLNGVSEKTTSLLSLGIDPADVRAFFVGADGSFHLLVNALNKDGDSSGMQYSIAFPCEIPTERVLVSIGFETISDHMARTIADLNRERRDVFFEAIDYRNYDSGISAEVLPDLVVMDEALYGRLQASGSLADLTDLMEADGGVRQSNFFPSVWTALSDDGGALRRLASAFWLETMACDKNTVEGRTQLNLTDLRNLLSEMPPKSSLYEPYYTSERLLEDLCTVNRKALGTGNDFDAALYAELLNFSNLQQAAYSYNDYASDSSSMEKRIYDGKLLMLQAHIATLDELKWYDAFFESGACFAGWPTLTGSVSRFCFDETLGMTISCSKGKYDGVRQLIQAMLAGDHMDAGYGFPVIRERLEKEMAEDAARVAYRVDEKGKFETDKNGKKIEIARDSWYSPEWRRHFVYALTEAQKKQLLTLIDNSV